MPLLVNSFRQSGQVALVIAAAALFGATGVQADVPTVAIDAVVERSMAEQHIPGLSIAVLQDGQLLYARGYGVANAELSVPATEATVYQSGSVGKMFTATAVMMLVQDGRLDLDAPIAPFFPEAKGAWAGVTVRHLLSHRSGIAEYDDWEGISVQRDYSDTAMVELLAKRPLDFAPGTSFRYSNSGYVILGMLVGRITGEFYGDFLKRRLFEPAGMKTTRVNSLFAVIPNRAAGYVLRDGRVENAGPVSQTFSRTGDGSLVFTVLDLAKWDQALSSHKFLTPASLDLMWQAPPFADGHPPVINYGFGWENNSLRGHKIIEHSGTWQGFRARFTRFDTGLTIALLSNLSGTKTGLIVKRIAGTINPELAPFSPIADADPDFTASLKTALTDFLLGKASPLFARSVQQAFDAGRRDQVLHEFGSADDVLSFALVSKTARGTRADLVYRIDRSSSAEYVYVTRQGGKVVTLAFQHE